MHMSYITLIISALSAAFGQLFFKLGTNHAKGFELLYSYKLWLGVLLYFLSTVLWIYALSKLPLNRAYPFTALTFVLVFILGYLFLGETISIMRALGLMAIVLGFLILYFAN